MTRDQALRNLLKSIFGNITLSESEGKIVKGISMYANCNYSVKSYNNFRRLFEIAFIDPNPQYSDLSSFDREKAVINAKKYLIIRGIKISDDLSDEKQRKQIFEILNSFLHTIIIDEQGDSKSVAKDKDITDVIIKLTKDTQNKLILTQVLSDPNQLCLDNSIYSEIIDSRFNDQYDKCNCPIMIDCSNNASYQTLRILRDFQFSIPCLSEADCQSNVDADINLQLAILSGRFSSNKDTNNTFKSYPVHFFADEDRLSSITKWKFSTYVNEETIIANAKSNNLYKVIYDFINETNIRAVHEVEKHFIEELKPFWKVNCQHLERLITSIASLKDCQNYFNENMIIQDSHGLEEFLYNICEGLFWDFEVPYLTIKQTYQDNLSKGLYITIQNTIIILTDILNNNGKDLALQFKDMLDIDSFRNHQKYIKKIIDSNILFTLQLLENKLAAKYTELFKVPESVMDYFLFLRKKTFSNFESSLYNYSDALVKSSRKR